MADQAFVAVPATVEFPSGNEGDWWALFLARLQLLTSATKERRYQGHFINIHSSTVKRLLGGGNKYRRRVDDLVDAGVVEIYKQNGRELYYDGKGRTPPGKQPTEPFSKSYRLGAEHRTGKARVIALHSKPASKKAAIVRQVDADNLGSAGCHFHRKGAHFLLKADTDHRSSCHWAAWTASRWLTGDDFAKRCDHGRYHALITQTSRTLRQHIRTDEDASLALVDVSACQPVLLGLAAGSPTNGHPSTSRPNHILLNVASFSIRSRNEWRRKSPSDAQHWLELSESRAIYDYFFDQIQEFDGQTLGLIRTPTRPIWRDLRSLSRKAFKRATLIPMFDLIDAALGNPIFQITQRDFPTIAEYILQTKKHRHQKTATILQGIESSLMIDGCGTSLLNEHPDEPVQPIHDALLCKTTFAPTAKSIIAEQFERIGLHPQIKIEPCEVTN